MELRILLKKEKQNGFFFWLKDAPNIYLGLSMKEPHFPFHTNYSLAKIDARLLQSFLRDLLREASKSQEVTEDKLIEYTDTMVSSDWHTQTNTRWNWPGTDTNIAKGTKEQRVQCSHQSNFFRSFHNFNFLHKS